LEAQAMKHLNTIASLTVPVGEDSLQSILNKINRFKDQHTFRLLATIATPLHSYKARQRAIEELPKRVSGLGSGVTNYVRTLARRVAMGTINVTTVQTCIAIAQSSFDSNNVELVKKFLFCVEILSEAFPSMVLDIFSELVNLFLQCRSCDNKNLEIENSLMKIFSSGASGNALTSLNHRLKKEFQSALLTICTKDGESEEQCRSAILIFVSMLGTDEMAVLSLAETLVTEHFENNLRMDHILISLSALVDCLPNVVQNKFILEKLHPIIFSTLELTSKPPQHHTKTKVKKRQKANENNATFSCKCICSSINFLVSYIRSVVISTNREKRKNATSRKSPEEYNKIDSFGTELSRETISTFFSNLGTYLSSDFNYLSKTNKEALKYHSAVGLMRLSDSSLGLAEDFMSIQVWHLLGSLFLNTSMKIREGVLSEWNHMMLGTKSYCHDNIASAPALRFLAYSIFIPDSAVYFHEIEPSPNFCQTLKSTTFQTVSTLRRTCEQTLAQCRAISHEAEENFEKRYKMNIMPEFVVPFAFHLLVFREEALIDDDEKDQIFLKKRLKFLFEPLVLSLGESADNISLLLRMVEILSKYRVVSPYKQESSITPLSPSNSVDNSIQIQRLKFVTKNALEVLLKFVKKDINLTPYPSPIFVPSALFQKLSNPGSSVKKQFNTPGNKSNKSQVTFSQEVQFPDNENIINDHVLDISGPSDLVSSSNSSSIHENDEGWEGISPISSCPSPTFTSTKSSLLRSTSKRRKIKKPKTLEKSHRQKQHSLTEVMKELNPPVQGTLSQESNMNTKKIIRFGRCHK